MDKPNFLSQFHVVPEQVCIAYDAYSSSMSLCASSKGIPVFFGVLFRDAVMPDHITELPMDEGSVKVERSTFFMLCYHRGLSRLSVPKVSMRPTFH